MFSFLNNIPQVTKNILLLNVFLYFASMFLASKNIDIEFGAYYMNSPNFKPYQIVSHFFMHDRNNFMHIFMNMYLLVILGSYLERLWGPKKYFLLYIASALGAFALYNGIGMYKVFELKELFSLDRLNYLNQVLEVGSYNGVLTNSELNYLNLCNTPMVGASGAVFGILAAFAILFPNTEFMLYFAIPVKAKFLVGGYFLWELFLSLKGSPGDNIAHLAHVGGAIVGAAIVLYWRKTDKKSFW